MDELSTHDLRSSAFAANLRRVYRTPAEEDMPASFEVLLSRLSKIQPPPAPGPRDAPRLGA